MRRIVRILAVLGLIAVVVAVVRRLLAGQGEPPPAPPWEPITPPEPTAAPDPERPAAAGTPAGNGAAWVDADADGSCPSTHPVKAKLSSKIFHVAGGSSYDRTGADRCYRDEASAEADGLRRAKR